MGGAACKLVIIEGNLTYGAIETFKELHSSIKTSFLEAAVKSSCDGIFYSSLYSTIEDKEDRVTSEFTNPIIEMHRQITLDLTSGNHQINQEHINELAIQLFKVTRRLYTLDGVTIDSLGLLKLTDIIK